MDTSTSSRGADESPSSGTTLLAEVYEQFRAIAQDRLNNETPGHTLQATALVHEAWLKLCQRHSVMALDPASVCNCGGGGDAARAD